jgi:hypothetical protein
MNTLATSLPNLTATANSLVAAPWSMLGSQGAKLRVWAFAAAVRLSDLDRPIILKLLVELAIILRALALMASDAHCTAGEASAPSRARRPAPHGSKRRIKPAKRSATVNVPQYRGVAATCGSRHTAPRVCGGAMQSSRTVRPPAALSTPAPVPPPVPARSHSLCPGPTSRCA